MELVKNDGYEVLTSEGWKSFTGIKKTITRTTILLEFDDDTGLECTPDHLVLLGENFVYAKNVKPSDVLEGKKVVGVYEIEEEKEVYDLLNVSDTSHYITNGITSHNCAFVDNWDDFSSSVLNTITSGKTTKICFVSTPKGLNHFHDYWKGAQAGKNGYFPVHVTWRDVPGRDEEWKKETLAMMNFDVAKFNQEQETAFLGSSGTLIAGWKLEILMDSKGTPIYDSGFFKKYEEPKKGDVYVLVADVSRGKGLDFSTFSIVNITKVPHRVVSTYRSNVINTVDFASVIATAGKLYNDAFVLVEVNDIGAQVPDILFHDYEYENILHTETKGRYGKRITARSGPTVDRGIRTTKTVKSMGCSMLKMLIEQDKLMVTDTDTINEFATFSAKGTSYEAEAGKHDDMVMTLVLFAWLTLDPFFAHMTDENVLASLREKTEQQLYDEITPFLVDTGHDEDLETIIPPMTDSDLWL